MQEKVSLKVDQSFNIKKHFLRAFLIENRINYLEEQNFDVEGSRKMNEQLFLEKNSIQKLKKVQKV